MAIFRRLKASARSSQDIAVIEIAAAPGTPRARVEAGASKATSWNRKAPSEVGTGVPSGVGVRHRFGVE